jgi:hypothetical protein
MSSLRRAFGLALDCDTELPALPALDGVADDEPTRVRLGSSPEGLVWPVDGSERIVQEQDPGSPLERFAERHPEAGHRLFAAGFGEAIISADGRLVTGAPREERPGRFERLLVGRVLPWTALVRGFEVFHAAAVTIEGRAVVLIGQSGAGKTSLALRLLFAGAGFLTDDVLAVDRGPDGAPRAHPGARAAGLRPPERERLASDERELLGPLRMLDDKSYATLTPRSTPAPLGAVFFLTRPGDEPGGAGEVSGGPLVARLERPPAELLLASTFVLSVRTPDRLVNLLELCADIAASVPQYRVRITPEVDSARTAEAIRAVASSPFEQAPPTVVGDR